MLKLSLLISIIAINVIGSYQQCANTHTVQSGDSCWSIWSSAKLNDGQFFSFNPNIDCGNLKVGQVVCLSAVTTAAPTTTAPLIQVSSLPFSSCTQAHLVQPGDQCWTLMGQFNLDPMKFINLNPNIDCNNLQPGSLVCVALVVTTTTLAPTTTTTVTYPPLCKSSMTVQPDDNCFIIMRYKGITYEELMRLNPTLDCANLKAGTLICLEVFTTPAPTTTLIPTTIIPTSAPCTQTYTVKSGDTCWSISSQATKLGDAFYSLNPSIVCNDLKVGQTVCIDNCPYSKYEVKPGDYCWQIITQHNLTSEQFFALNPGLECGSLKPGNIVNVGKASC